jgi:hypothetical protein
VNYARYVFSFLTLFFCVACNNGGKIQFFDDSSVAPVPQAPKSAGYSFVPASQALMVESGKTTANGYHAKVQFNPQSGTKLTGGGYTVKLKYTTRNR